ncbi:MAG: exopolysaccharide biosynthesis polyprenyl glycosylphosphotransferase [Bacteroidota bacterium]
MHKLLVVISEFLLLSLACRLSFEILQWISGPQSWDYLIFMPVLCLGWIGISALGRQYDPEYIFDFQEYMRSLPSVVLPQVLVAMMYLFALHMGNYISTFALPFYFLATNLVIGFRWAVSRGYSQRRVVFGKHNIMVVGAGKGAHDLLNFFDGKRMTVNWFEIGPDSLPERLEQLKQHCATVEIDEMYLALPLSASSLISEISEFCDDHHIRWRVASNFELLRDQPVSVHFFDQMPIISLRRDPLASYLNRLLKRFFDILFSAFVLLFVFPPILLIVGTAIKLSSKGPVFFRQMRSGRKNRAFLCFKFRTMRVHQAKEYKQATKDDPRITSVGRFLRKTNLDEFPQFINVLLGDMSVVGPRPHPIKLNELYAPKIYKYEYRHLITPGITGHAQVNGYRGETKDPEEMEKRIEYDNWYIRNWTFGLDILIVFQTVFKTLIGDKNAY